MSQNSLKHLLQKKRKITGRNNQGRITVRRRGGGHRKSYRKINFNYLSPHFQVLSIEYDPNRNASISSVKCLISSKIEYILTTKDVNIGDVIDTQYTRILNGGRYFLKDLPPNYLINNIELKPQKGGQLARSSGSFSKIIQKDYKNLRVKIKLPSLEERYVSMFCQATVGSVSNNFFHIKKLKKAGNSRWLGRRPSVRGVAMNPIDHPHGGGEGKTSGGRVSVTPWGHLTIGKPTRKKRSRTDLFIVKNRKQF